MSVKLTFYGAAKTTTGSMHLLEVDDMRILLDCGLYQGQRKQSFEKNRNLPFDPASLDKVVLSHAHVDHSGNIPPLVKRGFRGKIVCTSATRDLCDAMLRDSAYLQMRDVEFVNKKRARQGKNPFEPLYTPEDVDKTMPHFLGIGYEETHELAPGVKLRFHDAGHILGAAITSLDFEKIGGGKRLLFTGDLGRWDTPIIRDPVVVKDVDWLITESTYGNRTHPPKADVQGRLKSFVEDIHMQRSKLVIPAFSVGRTQTLVYFLRELYEAGRIPLTPVYVDSPLSLKATEVHASHPECYDADTMKVFLNGREPFQFRGLTYISDLEESKRLNYMDGPAIIISASGMCEGGRIQHHLAHTIESSTNIVLIVGYQAEHTLGRRLVEHKDPVKIFGEPYRLRARVHTINALSAHADRNEMQRYFTEMGPAVERAFCVHGEEEPVAAVAKMLSDAGARQVDAPNPGETFELA